jgi:hypothetical protein
MSKQQQGQSKKNTKKTADKLTQSHALATKRKALMWFIALSIPIVFFVASELLLRLFAYGQSLPLFIPNPANSHYILPRPDIVRRYFAQDADLPSVTMEANFLLKEKPANGYRVFVQGGSTAAGFPYGLGASLAGMLDKRLRASLPKHYVEVVNTALAAVNSYTVLDLADEIIAQQPDAIMLYMGHNEYLGLLGVGSNYTAANSQASTLLFLKLKELRLFQLLQNTYQQLSLSDNKVETKTSSRQSRTFMAKVAKHKDIALDSDLYRAGLEQFSTNLKLLLDKYQTASIPVYLATIASNIADQKPFASVELHEQHKAALGNIQKLLAAQQTPLAIRASDELAVRWKSDNNALAHFALGQIYRQLGQASAAKEQLNLAKDLDLLRFRAPSEINQIIQQSAARYSNVVVVDVESRFEQQSPLGLIGDNLMLEHLHPNVQGYFLLADTFYLALQTQQTLADWQTVDTAQAWKERPLLPAEEYLGFAKILQLKNDYPFTEVSADGQVKPLRLPPADDWQLALGKSHFLKQIDWLTMMQRSLGQYQADNNLEMTLKTAVLLADALPHDPVINAFVANLYIGLKQAALADYYKKRSELAKSSRTS